MLAQQQSPKDRVIIVAEYPKQDPEALFDFWIVPDLLKKWWPPSAEVEPRRGGTYHFSWPKQNWHLRGKFTRFDRGKSLGFTWKWDHEPSDVTTVEISFEPLSKSGTKLTLGHSPYPDTPEGRKTKEGHIEGWMFFLGELQRV